VGKPLDREVRPGVRVGDLRAALDLIDTWPMQQPPPSVVAALVFVAAETVALLDVQLGAGAADRWLAHLRVQAMPWKDH